MFNMSHKLENLKKETGISHISNVSEIRKSFNEKLELIDVAKNSIVVDNLDNSMLNKKRNTFFQKLESCLINQKVDPINSLINNKISTKPIQQSSNMFLGLNNINSSKTINQNSNVKIAESDFVINHNIRDK